MQCFIYIPSTLYVFLLVFVMLGSLKCVIMRVITRVCGSRLPYVVSRDDSSDLEKALSERRQVLLCCFDSFFVSYGVLAFSHRHQE